MHFLALVQGLSRLSSDIISVIAFTGQGKITKARPPQGLTRGSLCPWLLFASYVLALP